VVEKPIFPPLTMRRETEVDSLASSIFKRLASKPTGVSLDETRKTSASSETFFARFKIFSKTHPHH